MSLYKKSDLMKWYDLKYCLEKVNQDCYNFGYVKRQTPNICLAAVTRYGDALKYVMKQTLEICLAAVQNNWPTCNIRSRHCEIS